MQNIGSILVEIFTKNGFVMAFLIVGIMSLFSNFISAKLTRGRIHASAIAIFIGLVLAYIGGSIAGGEKGLSDIGAFAGIGILGGSSLRDFAIIATSCDAKMSEIKKCGLMGTTSGTSAGLAATDPKLVPYGAMTATFYTGLGCLLCPSVLYTLTNLIL